MAVALTPDAYLWRSGTAWDVYFSWCGWRRIDTDRGVTTILAYLGSTSVGGTAQFSVSSSRKLIVYRGNDFSDYLAGTGPTLAVGEWWFFGITTIAPDEPGNVQIYYAKQGGSLTQVSGYYPGFYQYQRHYVGGRPGTDGQDGAWRLHGSAALDRSWSNTTLTPSEMAAEFASSTPVKAGVWANWPMATAATAGDDASGNGRALTAETGTGSITTTTGPAFGTNGTASFVASITATAVGGVPSPTSSGAVAIAPDAKYQHTPAVPLGLPVSWCGWVRVDTDLASYTTIAYIGLAGMIRHVLLSLQADGVTPILFDSDYQADITGTALQPSTWHFLAFTANTGTGALRLYQAAEGTTPTLVGSGTYDGLTFQGAVIELAGRPDNQYPAAISLANVRLWAAALTLPELAGEMESETAVRTIGLFADWAFHDAPTATDDGSANGNDLTLVLGSGSVATSSGPALGHATTGTASLTAGLAATATGAVTRPGSAAMTSVLAATAAGARQVTGAAAAALGPVATIQGSIGTTGRAVATMGISASMVTGTVLGAALAYLGFVHEKVGTASAVMAISAAVVAEPVVGRARAELGMVASVNPVRTVFGRADT